jgi:hypothetical protein
MLYLLSRQTWDLLAKHRLSDNADTVKHFSSTPQHALGEERHFALVGIGCHTNQGSLVIVSGQEFRSDPCISSIATSIMITSSNSSVNEEQDAQSISRCSTSHHGDVRAVPRANRTFLPARSPIPGATSSTGEWLVFVPSLPWRSSAPSASPGGNTYCAIPGCCAR